MIMTIFLSLLLIALVIITGKVIYVYGFMCGVKNTLDMLEKEINKIKK